MAKERVFLVICVRPSGKSESDTELAAFTKVSEAVAKFVRIEVRRYFTEKLKTTSKTK